MAPTHFCPCCFLNRISILRNTPDQSAEVVNPSGEQVASSIHRCTPQIQRQEKVTNSNVSIDFNPSHKIVISDDSSNFMLPERLVKERAVKSSDTFVVTESGEGSYMKTKYTTASTGGSIVRSELAQRISTVLEEQKRFLETLNVSVYDEGGIRLELNADSDFESGSNGELEKLVSYDQTLKDHVVSFASGDQFNFPQTKAIKRTRKLSKMQKKPVFFFNDEPIKLPKCGESESKELLALSDANVKMLFFPKNVMKGSLSSVEDGADAGSVESLRSNSSAYVTAANSRSDSLSRALLAAADQVCRADSREVVEIE